MRTTRHGSTLSCQDEVPPRCARIDFCSWPRTRFEEDRTRATPPRARLWTCAQGQPRRRCPNSVPCTRARVSAPAYPFPYPQCASRQQNESPSDVRESLPIGRTGVQIALHPRTTQTQWAIPRLVMKTTRSAAHPCPGRASCSTTQKSVEYPAVEQRCREPCDGVCKYPPSLGAPTRCR